MYRIYICFLLLCLAFNSFAQNSTPLLLFKAQNSLYGYRNSNGEVIVEAQFEEAFPFVGNYAFVKNNQAWGMINSKGKAIIPASYEKLGWTLSKENTAINPDEVLAYKSEGKWGLISTKNKVITSPKYDFLQPFSNGKIKAGVLASASTPDTLFGIIDTQGKEILPLQYHLLEITPKEGVLLIGMNKLYTYAANEIVACSIKSYGLVSWNNTGILPAIYKNIKITEQGVKVTPFNSWKLIGEKDSVQATYAVDSIYAVSATQYAFVSSAKAGIIENTSVWQANKEAVKPEEKGFIISRSGSKYEVWISKASDLHRFLPATYDSILIDTEKFIRVGTKEGKDWKWEIVKEDNQNNIFITQRPYSWIETIADNPLIKVKDHNHYGYIDKQGTEIIPVHYDSLSRFVDSLCVAIYKGKYGILHQNGKWVFEPKADYFAINRFGYFIRKMNGKYEVLNSLGKIKHSTSESLAFLEDGSIAVKQKNKYGRISPTGVACIPPLYDSISLMTPDQTFWAYAGKNIFLYKSDGEILIKPGSGIEKIIYVYGHEYIPAHIGGKFGFIDGFGRLRLSNRYESVRPFEGNLAAVKLAGKWGFVTKQDKIAVQPYYDEVQAFINEQSIVRKGDKYGIIDEKGKVITPFIFDKIYRHTTGNYVVEQKGKQGMLNKRGFEIVYAKYDEVLPQQDHKAIVRQNTKYGLLDEKGILILPMVYDNIIKNPFSATYLTCQIAQPFTLEELKVNVNPAKK